MNKQKGRLKQVFAKGKAFIAFTTAGDPSIEITEQLVYEMAAAGADLIELGIPFSDPVAEGPIIQDADKRALDGGMTTDKLFEMIARIRRTCTVPLALMTYVNPIFTYGTERFMSRCREVQVDAVIVPDVPFEEKAELQPDCDRFGITLISMIAPTSQDRIRAIAREADGFLYCVSSMGVTGVRRDIGQDVAGMIRMAKEVRDIPCAIGFGISTPDQAKAMAAISDGVIVGSAIVRIVAQYGEDCVVPVRDYVCSMVAAIRATDHE